MTTPSYDTDFYAWTQAQATALQAKDWPALDVDHLTEDIETLSRNGAARSARPSTRLPT